MPAGASRLPRLPTGRALPRARSRPRRGAARRQVLTARGAKGRTDVPKIVDWYMDGKINIDDLITHTMPLAEINTAFDLLHDGKSIRSVVTY